MKIELEQAFATLGVPASASKSDIRSAYRTLIRAHHPDHASGDVDAATERLAAINAAKDLIDKAPLARPMRPSSSKAQTERPRSPAEARVQREQAARTFRKSMEARAAAEADKEDKARRAAEQAARSRTHQLDRDEATERAREEARLRRQAAFAAAISGQNTPSAGGSILSRLRALGAR